MTSLRGVLFVSTMLAGLSAGLVAAAQTAPPPTDSTPPASAPTGVEEVVVTGSRIKHSNFNTSSPVQVITQEDAALTGAVDTAELLQQSTVANNSSQINNFYGGFVTTGGPGANTLSLRGLGSQRTLILIDGKRLGPAGTGGTVGPIDLNTIPESFIDHVEVLKDGASSIYGSDAVAGVVNIITKKNIDGGELHVIAEPTEHGGGNTYEIDGNFGKTFDKGYVTVGFDAYRQNPLRYGQRPFFACASDHVTNPTTGAPADLIDPATGQAKCNNIFTRVVIDLANGLTYNPNPAAVAGGGPQGADVNGYQAVGLVFPGDPAATLASAALINYTDNLYNSSFAISPVTRYTINASAGYDLSAHAHLYSQLLLNRRESQQVFDSQLFFVVDPTNPTNPGFGYPLPVIPQEYSIHQKVDYGRIVVGLNGDLPKFSFFKDWTYDIYGQLSHSSGRYNQDYALGDRVAATTGASPCDQTVLSASEPGAVCVPVNYFQAVQNGGLTPAEAKFLYVNEAGRTMYNDYYLEGTTGGDLFNLPAGPVGVSLGFQVRREEIDDTPAADAANGNTYNFSSAGRTKGSDSIEEGFGELSVPVLKDLPFVRSLDLSASGRVSNYKSYGTNETYKVGLSWIITDWLAFRATHGTAFRAPALYELFLADQSSFLGQLQVDPCIRYGSTGVSQNIQKNCAAQGIPSNYTGGNSSSATILTGGGIGNLKPETSYSNDVGFVLTPKWYGLNLKVSVDYYTFNISNQIQQFGAANIVNQCYNSTTFPANPFCTLFTRDLDPASSTYLQITQIKDNYVNVATQIDQGLDLNIRYAADLPYDTKLTIESQNAWTFYTTTNLLGGAVNNYLGQVGQPSYVGNLRFRFDHGPWTVEYFLDMVGHSSDDKFSSNLDTNYNQSGLTVFENHVVPFYTISTLAVRRRYKDLTVELGVKNLLDTNPPIYSAGGFQARIGTAPLASQYDYAGRTFFVDLKKTF